MISMKEPLAIAPFLPHRAPMILLDYLVDYREDYVHARVTITKQSPFYEDDGVPAYVSLEYMAQAVAAWTGIQSKEKHQQPKIGFLLGSRQLDFSIQKFKNGVTLDVYGQMNYFENNLASFDCRVEFNGRSVVTGGITVFQPHDATLMTPNKI